MNTHLCLKVIMYVVVSLYYTMIEQISPQEFPVSHQLAGQILNLPIHQNVKPDALVAMVNQLGESIKSLSSNYIKIAVGV